RLGAASVAFDGSARARGREGAGGVVRLEGVRAVTLDSPRRAAAISVTGGDVNAVTPGGSVFLSASAGDIVVRPRHGELHRRHHRHLRRGAIAADGLSTGFGSDAGFFSLVATGAMRCVADGTPCVSGADCAPGDTCVESGGAVTVQAQLSAAGGAGLGAGCFACEVRGTGAVTVSAEVDVSGGRQGGLGGEVLAVQSLATLSALPDGASSLTCRVGETVAPDAVLRPAFTSVTDPTLSPCPASANGQIEPLADCDGHGTWPGSGAACVPPGNPVLTLATGRG